MNRPGAGLCFVVLFLAGCTTPYRDGVVLPEGRGFPGLQSLSSGRIDVISIHGMCTHNRDWVVNAGEQMSTHLGLGYTPPGAAWKKVGELEVWKNELRNDTGQIALINYAILWSGLTTPKKAPLCPDSGMVTPSCSTHGDRSQAALNNMLKSNLINDCLSDAIIYTGSGRNLIRDSVQQALELVNADRARTPRPAAIIAESLGSKIIADAVSPGANPSAAAISALAGTQVIYMAANQIPLLELAGAELGTSFGAAGTLDTLRQAIVGAGNPDQMSAVMAVAFTDPNDLLSYELETGQSADANVRISIARVLFGQIANPWQAHTGYLDNPRVWRYIACGSDRSCE